MGWISTTQRHAPTSYGSPPLRNMFQIGDCTDFDFRIVFGWRIFLGNEAELGHSFVLRRGRIYEKSTYNRYITPLIMYIKSILVKIPAIRPQPFSSCPHLAVILKCWKTKNGVGRLDLADGLVLVGAAAAVVQSGVHLWAYHDCQA